MNKNYKKNKTNEEPKKTNEDIHDFMKDKANEMMKGLELSFINTREIVHTLAYKRELCESCKTKLLNTDNEKIVEFTYKDENTNISFKLCLSCFNKLKHTINNQ